MGPVGPRGLGPKFVEIFLINGPILLPIAPCSQAPVPPLKEEQEGSRRAGLPCWLFLRKNTSARRLQVCSPVLAVLKEFN